jgi:chitodextrinase
MLRPLVRRFASKPSSARGRSSQLLFLLLAASGACGRTGDDQTEAISRGLSTPTFVQVNAADPQSAQTTVSVPFTAAQTAGNLNVAIVGWNDTTAQVATVTDTKGNVYVRAVGPTVRTGALSQSIYYAKNIAAATAGSNQITVTFSPAASFPDIRVLEYSGIDPVSPVDVTATGTGSSATSTTGAVTTTSAVDVLVAGNMVSTWNIAAGSGFTRRIITSPNSDLAEDRTTSAVGSSSASATLGASGQWVIQMVAFRAAGQVGDTQAPTAPSNLVASAASSAQINLSWTASTDNVGVTSYLVERCQGAACTTFAQIGTISGTTYNDSGLTASTAYRYRIRATDAAANLGAYSAIATATTPAAADTQAPTAPSGLTATAASSSQINLSWTASTDNVAVTNYLVERCQGAGCASFAQIGTATGTSFNDTGRAATTTYGYRVRATDAAANLGAYSTVASATTPAAPDTQAPTAPSALGATAVSSVQINLVWTASTDNVGVVNYLVERCQGAGCASFAQIATATTTSYNDATLTASASYSYRVRAADAASNLSGYSNVASATTSAPPDTQAPTAPSGLVATAVSSSQINLGWTASTDNVGVGSYLVERCLGAGCSSFAQVGTTAGTSFTDSSLVPSASYSYRVRASDTAANLSGYSNTASAVTSPPPDTQPPTAPSALTALAVSSSQINLAWTAATDDVGVINYRIERCAGVGCSTFVEVGSTAGTAFSDTGLTATTTYGYRVRAKDAAANLGPYTTTASATTFAPPDTQAPTAPSGLSASAASSTQIDVGWTASTDNVAVTSYLIERCAGASCTDFAQIGTTAGVSISDTTLDASSAYRYRVRATDAAGNLSGYSNIATASTSASPDTQPPTAPIGFAALAISSIQIDLGWIAATDNVAVTQYLIERCSGLGCTSFAQVATSLTASYSDTGLLSWTQYRYRVRATDAAGNMGAYSNIVSAITLFPPDTQPPSTPTNLTAMAVSSTQINLGWTASTDDVGVTTYYVDRCQGAGCANFVTIGSTSGLSFSDTGLGASASYSYRVRASDAANNLSGFSNVATDSTAAPADTQAPTAPANLTAAAVSSVQISLGWTAATDNLGVAGYLIERCQGAGCSNFVQIGTSAGTTYDDGTLSASTSYSYRVRATDSASNLGGYSNSAAATTQVAPDTQAPTAPAGLTATAITSTQINLGWTASTDDTGVTNYLIERCQGSGCSNFVQVTTTAGTAYSDTGLSTWTRYNYRVRATDAAGNLSAYSNSATAITPYPPDTEPPTAPSNLTAATVSSTQINLAWTASTDNVAVSTYLIDRCQGVGCSSFVTLSNTAGTNFSDSTLIASASYSYRVRATDAANNLSGFSNVASATTAAPPDTQAPTTPAGLTATAASGTRINLGWTLATDNVAVTAYLVERCQGAGCASFAQITSTTSNICPDSSVSAGTTYSYRVRATDAAGNLGAYTATATANTPSGSATPAFAQRNFATPQGALTTVTSAFTAAQTAGDLNVAIIGWNDTTAQIASVTDSKGNVYALAVGPTQRPGALSQSIYYAKNIAAAAAGANTVTVTFNTAAQYADVRILEYSGVDTTAPLDVTAVGTGSSASAATAAVTTTSANELLVAGNMVATLTGSAGAGFTSRVITSPDGDIAEDRLATTAGSYSGTASLVGSGDWVMQMAAFRAGSGGGGGGDTQAPTNPSALVATATSSSQIGLTWTASTDNVGVTSYLVERCAGAGCTGFVQIATAPSASYADAGLTSTSSYSYRVRAVDAASNLSGFSGVASATTPAPSDSQAPTAPSNLVATGAVTQVTLGWTAATDNVGVASYLVERCTGAGCAVFTQVGSSATAGFVDSGLTATTSYGYRVRATDAAGNLGPYSGVASVTTGAAPDTQAPSAPSSLVATGSASQIGLVWTGSTDNVGVTGYLIERCAGVGCSSFAQIITTSATSYADTTLVTSNSYSYRVRATDAAGNLGAYSNIASAINAPPSDTQAPTAPANLTASGGVGQIVLAWAASSDNVAVTSYLVERCLGVGCTSFAQIGTTAGTGQTDSGLTASASYSYRVRATDAAGNLSAYSNIASATNSTADTQPPSTPASLVATGTIGRVDLGWTASIDDVAVTAYLVERCQGAGCSNFVQIASTSATTLGDTGLSASTTYSYRVRASDAASNLSGFSNVAVGTTQVGSATPSYVQGNYAVPHPSAASVPVTYQGAQVAGHLNVVVVGWNDVTRQVTSVSDTRGNVYVRAVGPTLFSTISQSIYYAKNIASANANGNTVTVAFSAAATAPDVRILEYAGIDQGDPLDVVSANQGNSATTSSGTVTTANAFDLLIGANTVETAATGAGTNFTLRSITTPNADLVEDRVVAVAGAYSATAPVGPAGAWVMQMVAFKASNTAPPGDTTPPTVVIATPAPGSTLSGSATVTVTATDAESGVSGVQLVVDGIPVGPPDTSSPYSFTVNTALLSNGAHAIGAYAWDGLRNMGNALAVSMTFSNSNPANPAQVGLWSGKIPLGIVSVHGALLPDGRILMSDGQPSFGRDARTWDPTTSSFTNAVQPPVNIFCGAHEQMADGRIFFAGGHVDAHVGLAAANIFNPVTNTWTALPDMNFPRWYPSVTSLPDGRMLVLSGESSCNDCMVNVPEIYDPATNSWAHLFNTQFQFSYYTHAYVLPDGRVLVPSTSEDPIVSQVLDLNALTWTPVGGPAVDGGSSAMYLPSKIVKGGTSTDPDTALRSAAATTYVLDMTQPSPTWRSVAPMNHARAFHTMTILPDGNVLVTGGGPSTAATDTANAVLPAELWSPVTETWTEMASMSAARLYHSIALLMPDGRVMTSGGGRFDDTTLPTDQFSAEFFSPPYLFKGPRPTITSAPSTLSLGQVFTVQTPDAARIASVSLVRFGTATHTINMSQRFLPLSFNSGSGSLSVTAPANRNLVPPGYYMLFIVDSSGVPSVAAILRI